MLKLPLSIVLSIILSLTFPKFVVAQPKVKDTAYGKVVGISDGDTFTILLNGNVQEKIRLHGIDAPEKRQDFGQVAKSKLSALIFSQRVVVKRTDRDRYGRTIALVYDSLNRCINEEMIRTGFAWHYLKYDTNTAWNRLEFEARTAKKGLWIQSNATPPWDWRKK